MDIRNYFKINTKTNIDKLIIEASSSSSKIIKKKNDYDNDKINTIEVFTDGSTINNGKKKKQQYGGIGIYFNNEIYPSISECLVGKITNNIAELKAIITAIDFIINLESFNILNTYIHIYSDSEYSINCIIKWSKNWEKNGWKKRDKTDISNKDLIIKLFNYYKKYKIKFIHVKAHTNEPSDSLLHKIWYGNKMADKLAIDASNKSSKIL